MNRLENEKPPLRQLPMDMFSMAVVEWNSRTTFGKILYPVWLFESAMMWVMAGCMFLLVGIPLLVLRTGDRMGEAIADMLPNTHKEESE